jgi:hypothetical protein
MDRLREHEQVELCYMPIYRLQENCLKFVFHNCQSLPLHIDDIKADGSFMAADIILLTETKLCQRDTNETYTLPGFCMHRNDFSPNRTAYGSMIYGSDRRNCQFFSANFNAVEVTIAKVFQFNRTVQVVGIYCRPHESIQNVCNVVHHLHESECISHHLPVIVMGDFNVDFGTDNNRKQRLQNAMLQYGYSQRINGCTTDGKTTIDLVFSNIDGEYGSLESYFSYHKPIWMAIE